MLRENKEQRSQIMRAVKSKNTAPEMIVRKLIYNLGYRYRLHGSHLPGNPDIFLNKKKKAIFIHGCFWHGHSCARGNRVPSNNNTYWVNKINRNKERDKRNYEALSEIGWQILIIWECDLKKIEIVREKLANFLHS